VKATGLRYGGAQAGERINALRRGRKMPPAFPAFRRSHAGEKKARFPGPSVDSPD